MEPIERFSEIVADQDFPVADAFLAFARAEYPDLDTDLYLGRLQDLGLMARSSIGRVDDPREQLRKLGRLLRDQGFLGDQQRYSDPESSFLNRVIDTKSGIPITLAVVWMETGRHAGMELVGIGMPMHFLVGMAGEDFYADPFNAMDVMTKDDAVALFGRLTQGQVPWQDEFLSGAPPRKMVRRALSNLKGLFATRGMLRRLLWVEEFLLAIPDTPPSELRDRARILASLGRHVEAIDDLRSFLESEPSPDDLVVVEAEIRRLISALN